MKNLHRQAFIYFLLPLFLLAGLGIPYAASGRLVAAVGGQAGLLDFLLGCLLLAAIIIPPAWGYRLTVRMANGLSQTADVVRRVAEGDFSRVLAAWAADSAELIDLEQGINATALHLQQRLSELNREKSRLETVLRTMEEGVLMVDEKKRVVLMNPAAEFMFATSAGGAIGSDHLSVTHNFQLDERIGQVLRQGEPQRLEFKRARPEEMILEGHLAAVPSGTKGSRGVLIVLRDITRFRRLEQMRTEFVSNVTHELRTPLTAVRGFAETLLDGGALEDPETARHFVGIIKRESDNLGRLIDDILDLSRIESGKWKFKREPVNLSALAVDSAGRLSNKAEGLGVTLQLAIPDDLPPVMGDPDRLAQVFLNLVDNALKYTPSGGSVTVSGAATPGHVSVSVADTGVGIPKLDLPRIFERFYRVDKARTRTTGGTGLGLSICKHIIEAHDGTIHATSEVGKGTTFILSLPVA